MSESSSIATAGRKRARTLDPDRVGMERLRRYKKINHLGKGAFAEVDEHVSGNVVLFE